MGVLHWGCVCVVTVQGGNDIITLYSVSSVKQHWFWSTVKAKTLQGVYIVNAANVLLLTSVKRIDTMNPTTPDDKSDTHLLLLPSTRTTKNWKAAADRFFLSFWITCHLTSTALSWTQAWLAANAKTRALDHTQCNSQYRSAGQGLMGPPGCHSTPPTPWVNWS